MTRSLNARPTTSTDVSAHAPRPTLADRVQKVAGGPILHAIARMPDRVKRLLLGGRSITIDGNTLDPTLQLALAMQHLSGREGLMLSEHVATARYRLNLAASQFPRVPADVTRSDVSIPGSGGDIPAVHIRSNRDDGAPLLVFYHGGGFVVGGYESHGNLCEVICAEAGVHVLFVDYRLAPEAKAPAAVDDAYAAYRWACGHAAELGADAGRIAVGGDSAGGNLAAVVAQRARNDGAPPPALQMLLYPITNFAGDTRSKGLFSDGFFLREWDMEFAHDKYLGDSGIYPSDPRVSPLLADDLSGLPPALVVTAGFDPLRDEGRQYAEALRAAGNDVDAREYGSMIHAFPNFFGLGGPCLAATEEIISALRAHLSRS
ncbi:alpha/beta hydrolase [Mycolicibacterium moriokaense]|nr:alpha/beta hydrolase [Mycolicibacterium moriokaense]